MRKSYAIAALMFSFYCATLSGWRVKADDEASVKGRFVGAWRLAWLEEPAADGKIHKADCTGLLVYTRDGHMSVQVMYRNPQTGGQGGPVQYAQGGYEASFGTYQIDETTPLSHSTLRARWCGASSAKIFRAHSTSPAISLS